MKILFDKNKELFEGNADLGVEFSSDIDANVWDTPLEDLGKMPYIIGQGKVQVSAPEQTIKFKDAPISFSGQAGAFLRVGVFDSADSVMEDLVETDKLTVNLCTAEEGACYMLFSVGYEVAAEAEGKWLFTGGSISAGVDGDLKQRLAVVKTVSKDTAFKDAIKATISELRLPIMIDATTDMDPGTFLVTESAGSIAGKFGAQVGYDFNWIVDSTIPELEGSVGIKAKLGAALGFGFEDAGNYALTLCRKDGGDRLDLKLYKLKKKGHNFAMSLAGSLQGDLDEDLEATTVSDITKAVLGAHYDQVLEVFTKIKDLSDLDNLKEELGGLTDDILIGLMNTSGAQALDQARLKLIGLLEDWEQLGDEAGATIWKLLDDQLERQVDVDLDQLREDITLIGSEDQKAVQEFLEEKLSKVGYQNTPFGKLLNSILPTEDLIRAVTDSELFKDLQEEAQAVGEFLKVENHIADFHGKLSEALHLSQIKKAIEDNTPENVSELIKYRIMDMVFKEGSTQMEMLEQIQEFIELMETKATDIVEKTKEALQKEYGASLAYTFQKTRERTALIDASFTLGDAEVDGIFKKVLRGHFNEVLTTDLGDKIVLHQGTLTHSINSQKTVALSLPYMKRDMVHINNSMATGKFIQEADGRLMMYELQAEDEIMRNRRMSQAMVEGYYRRKKKGMTAKEVGRSLDFSYTFRIARESIRVRNVEQVAEPFLRKFLFTEDGVDEFNVDAWLADMEAKAAAESPGNDRFGKTLVGLEVRVPSEIGSAWFRANANALDQSYVDVAVAIQQQLREVLPFYYFQQEEAFDLGHGGNSRYYQMFALLLYMSIAPSKKLTFKKKKELKYHWSWLIPGTRQKAVMDKATQRNLAIHIGQMRTRLLQERDPALRALASNFDIGKNEFAQILEDGCQKSTIYYLMNDVFNAEYQIIKGVINAGTSLAEAVGAAGKDDVDRTLTALAEFGRTLTQTLNSETAFPVLGKKDYTRFLSADIFSTVARTLDPTIGKNTQAVFELMVLKEDSTFDLNSYKEDGKVPDAKDMIVSTRIQDLT